MGLNPKFEKYAEGFSKVFEEYFGAKPTMGVLVFNGWLAIKDKKLKNFKKAGEEHARLLIGAAEDKELKESKING
ncbi:MAG: hypothetical protein J6T31_01945 [Methanobrevibacter sp.]|nr:hypothetical protein [Methanobrevibacter sp.]